MANFAPHLNSLGGKPPYNLMALGQDASPGRLRKMEEGGAPQFSRADLGTPVLKRGQLLPYKPNTWQRLRDTFRNIGDALGEGAEYLGRGAADSMKLYDVTSAAFRPRGNDLQGLSPEAQARIQRDWKPQSFIKSPEEAKHISPLAAEMAGMVGSVMPYVMAGGIGGAAGGATETALGRVAPRLAKTAIGKALPQMANQATTFGSVAAMQELIGNLADGEKARLADSAKRILASAGEGALFGAGQSFIGAPAAKALAPIAEKTGVLGSAAVGAVKDIAGGSPVIGLHMAEGAAPQDAAKEAAFFGALGAIHGAAEKPLSRAELASRIRKINEERGFIQKAETPDETPIAETPIETTTEAPGRIEEPTPIAEAAPAVAESPGASVEAPELVPEVPAAGPPVSFTKETTSGGRKRFEVRLGEGPERPRLLIEQHVKGNTKEWDIVRVSYDGATGETIREVVAPQVAKSEAKRQAAEILRSENSSTEIQPAQASDSSAGAGAASEVLPEAASVSEAAATPDIRLELKDRAASAEGNVSERGSIQLPGGKQTYEPLMTFSDPEVEKRFQKSKTLPGTTTKQHFEEIKQDIRKKLSKYDIPRNDPYFADARRRLNEMESAMDYISDDTLREYRGVLLNLQGDLPAKNDLFGKALQILDAIEDLERGQEVFQNGWTKETLQADKARLDETLLAHPDVAKAIEERRALYKSVIDENIAANGAIGRDKTEIFGREQYFRHMVIERLENIAPKQAGKRLKPVKSGFEKRRLGSELDIYSNHVDVDTLTLAQIKYDTEVARTLEMIGSSKYNALDSLKKKAKAQNEALIREHFAKMAEETGEDPDTLYRQLNIKQAIGFGKLAKLAEVNELPSDGKWVDLIEGIKDGSAETPEIISYMAWVMKNHPGAEAAKAAATVFKGMRLKADYIKTNLGDRFVTWRDVIPEGYEEWQPDPGNLFFSAHTISDALAEKMLNGILPEVTGKDVHTILAIGGKKPSYVIRSELASTLNNLKDTRVQGKIDKLWKQGVNQWKQYVLSNPKTLASYTAHNTGSDLDVMAFAPKTLLKLPKATEELTTLAMGGAPKGELKEWLKRGGEAATLSIQEAGAVNNLKEFRDYFAGERAWSPKKVWDNYFKGARKFTSTRESLLRYSAYLHFLEQMEKSPDGLPKNYAASIPREIRGLSDIRDRAFVMSNDLLGAYNEISRGGKWLREHTHFFWSFQEVNLKRYWQLIRNEAGGTAEGYARGVAKALPGMTVRTIPFLMKASSWWVALYAYNNVVHPDLEAELPQEVRMKPHIILGRDASGKVMYYDRMSASEDVLEWLGLDDLPQDYKDVLDGRKGVKELLVEGVKSSANKFIQGFGPQVKIPLEGVFRKNLYPDAFDGSPIRDTGEWLANQVKLRDEYDRLRGLPIKPFDWRTDPAQMLLGYRESDPGESAYYDVLDLKAKYLETIGKKSSFSGADSEKSRALYFMRKAARVGDEKAYKRFEDEYFNAGGTANGLNTSFRNLDPLNGLGKDSAGFIGWLSPEEKAKLAKADEYYKQLIRNSIDFEK